MDSAYLAIFQSNGMDPLIYVNFDLNKSMVASVEIEIFMIQLEHRKIFINY